MLSALFIARRAPVLSETVEALGVQRHKDLALPARKSDVIDGHGVNFKKKRTPWAPHSLLESMLTTWVYV